MPMIPCARVSRIPAIYCSAWPASCPCTGAGAHGLLPDPALADEILLAHPFSVPWFSDKHNSGRYRTGLVAERRDDVSFPGPVNMPAATKACILFTGPVVAFCFYLPGERSILALPGWKPERFFTRSASFLRVHFQAQRQFLGDAAGRGNPEQAYGMAGTDTV